MRHSSTRTKAGTAGWAPRLPRQPLERPAELSQELQPPASPAARARAHRWLRVLPAPHLPLAGRWLHGGGTKSHPTSVRLQSLWPHQKNRRLPHSAGFALPGSQPCPSLCWVELRCGAFPQSNDDQRDGQPVFSPSLASSGGELLQKLLHLHHQLFLTSCLVAQ